MVKWTAFTNKLIFGFLWLALSHVVFSSDIITQQTNWNPAKTRVVVICLARFAAKTDLHSFTTDDRLDTAFVNLLKIRGVPDKNITFVMDQNATLANIKAKIISSLQQSQPDEFLIFYVGTHGSYDAKTQQWSYLSYEGKELDDEWVLNTIDTNFKGKNALLLSDSCYSGGIVELVAKHHSPIQYAALSSTYSHNSADSGWRFLDVLLRAFRGDATVDLQHQGDVTLGDLFAYARQHMSFVVEDRPDFWAAPGFNTNLVLSHNAKLPQNSRLGKYEMVRWKSAWYKAEVIDVQGTQELIHYTDYPADSTEWVDSTRTKPYECRYFSAGDSVQVQGENSTGQWLWYPASVIKRDNCMHYIHYNNYDTTYDEWVGPSSIKPL